VSKRKNKKEWWQKPKNIRRLAMTGVASLIVVVGALYFLLGSGGGGGAGESQTRVLSQFDPAEPFTLPTTTGTDVDTNDYFGKGNVLLYFNEGMG
jgi:hypothetical protein